MNFILPLQKGLVNTSCGPITEPEDDSNMEELDLPTDFRDLPTRIDWSADLPANIAVPRVDVHTVILDFAAVSFLDISALKGLKTVSWSFTAANVTLHSLRVQFLTHLCFCCRHWKSWFGLKLRSTLWLVIVSMQHQTVGFTCNL